VILLRGKWGLSVLWLRKDVTLLRDIGDVYLLAVRKCVIFWGKMGHVKMRGHKDELFVTENWTYLTEGLQS
jgi:hypothetical protein